MTRTIADRLEGLGFDVTSLDAREVRFLAPKPNFAGRQLGMWKFSSGWARVDQRPDSLEIRFSFVQRGFLSFVALAVVPVAWMLSDMLSPTTSLLGALATVGIVLLLFVDSNESRKEFRSLLAETVDEIPGIDPRDHVA